MRVDGKEPFGLGGINERDAAEFQADAGKKRGHFPGRLSAAQEADDGAGNVEKGEGAKVPDVFFIGDGLANEAADEARSSSGWHSQPFMTDEGGDGDDGTADGADHAAAEKAHQESTFEREIGEAVGVANEAKSDAEDERRGHEQHEF